MNVLLGILLLGCVELQAFNKANRIEHGLACRLERGKCDLKMIDRRLFHS
jgi:hypothetical protein